LNHIKYFLPSLLVLQSVYEIKFECRQSTAQISQVVSWNNTLPFRVGKIFKCISKKSLLLTKAAFIWSKRH